MAITDKEIDACAAARRAEIAVALGAGDEDIADRWMDQASQAAEEN